MMYYMFMCNATKSIRGITDCEGVSDTVRLQRKMNMDKSIQLHKVNSKNLTSKLKDELEDDYYNRYSIDEYEDTGIYIFPTEREFIDCSIAHFETEYSYNFRKYHKMISEFIEFNDDEEMESVMHMLSIMYKRTDSYDNEEEIYEDDFYSIYNTEALTYMVRKIIGI